MVQSTCALCSKASCVCEAVTRILSERHSWMRFERRRADRVPFFRPVLIGLHDGELPRFSAFSRDLSVQSIGLLHIMPLECGEVVVRILSETGEATDLRVYIEWCQDCGEGWYMSGGRFLDA
jgi:hypothetical protein